MTITRTDRNQEWRDGVLVNEQVIAVDVTAEAVTFDIHAKLRLYLQSAETFLNNASPTNAQVVAQEKRNTRAIAALIRHVIGADLLVESTDT